MQCNAIIYIFKAPWISDVEYALFASNLNKLSVQVCNMLVHIHAAIFMECVFSIEINYSKDVLKFFWANKKICFNSETDLKDHKKK